MKLITNNYVLKTLDLVYAIDILKYNSDNIDFHNLSMPLKNSDFYTLEFTKYMLEEENHLQDLGKFYRFYIFEGLKKEILGDISIYDIKFGSLSSCYIGIKIDCKSVNRGIAKEVLRGCIKFIKNELRLHSIRVTILPDNFISQRLFESLGFEFDGIIKDLFLSENGWKDHFHYSLII